MSERVKIIDIAKGTSIVLVAFSHSHLVKFLPGLDDALAFFRMPLFFFLSGVFFNEAIDLGDLVFRKTDSLLKPYFVTLGVLLVIEVILGRPIISEAKGILYGNGDTITPAWVPLWFLPHLWVVFVFSYLIFSITSIQNKPYYYKTLIVLFLLVAGATTIHEFWHLPVNIAGKIIAIPGLPFSFDLVFLSSAYFISGRFLRERVKSFKPKPLLVFPALSLFILIATFTAAEVDLNLRTYNEPLVSTIEGCLGIYLMLSLAYFLNQLSLPTRVLCYAGEASLFILIFHKFFDHHVYLMLSSDWSVFKPDLYVSILSFGCCLILPLIVRAIVIRSNVLALFYLPLKTNKLLHMEQHKMRLA